MEQTGERSRLIQYLISFLLVIGFIFPISPVHAESGKTEKIKMVYFYISVCGNCNEAEKSINEVYEAVKATGKDIKPDLLLYNIESKQNFELFQEYSDAYNVPESKRHAPIVFIGDGYYAGKDEIREGLRNELLKEHIPEVKTLKPTGYDEDKVRDKFLDYKLFSIIAAGLVSGFNPCSLSMLLLLVSMLISKKSNIIYMGLAFCTGKFITYLLLGTILYSVLSSLHGSWFGILTKVLLATFAILISFLSIKDYFAAKDERYEKIKNQLPLRIRKFNHAWIKKITSVNGNILLFIMCFLLGIIISFGEFLCTGQIYIATIAYMIQNQAAYALQAFFYLLVYDVAFMIPLVTVTVVVEKGKAIFDISEMLRKALPVIKLVTAVLFIVFTAVIIF
jgi:Cytochrome c biogenesis protein